MKRESKFASWCSILLMAATFMMATSVNAAVLVVGPSESIQAAIDMALPGDTILVEPGVYQETGNADFGLRISTENLRLIGNVNRSLGEAGKVRLLPIAMTTLTTIGGLLPLATSGGPLWAGMSWCMIFGLLVATVLTLLVVPALYAILVETFRVKPIRLESATDA